MHSSLLHTTHGTVNTAPIELRIRLGFHKSVNASHTTTASAPAASALRRIAPKLPGFSTRSTTTIKGFSLSCKSSNRLSLLFTTAITPSVLPRYAIFSYTSFVTSHMLACSSISPAISLHTNTSFTSSPILTQCSNSRFPSTTNSPVRRLSADFCCNVTTAFTRGFCILVIFISSILQLIKFYKDTFFFLDTKIFLIKKQKAHSRCYDSLYTSLLKTNHPFLGTSPPQNRQGCVKMACSILPISTSSMSVSRCRRCRSTDVVDVDFRCC